LRDAAGVRAGVAAGGVASGDAVDWAADSADARGGVRRDGGGGDGVGDGVRAEPAGAGAENARCGRAVGGRAGDGVVQRRSSGGASDAIDGAEEDDACACEGWRGDADGRGGGDDGGGGGDVPRAADPGGGTEGWADAEEQSGGRAGRSGSAPDACARASRSAKPVGAETVAHACALTACSASATCGPCPSFTRRAECRAGSAYRRTCPSCAAWADAFGSSGSGPACGSGSGASGSSRPPGWLPRGQRGFERRLQLQFWQQRVGSGCGGGGQGAGRGAEDDGMDGRGHRKLGDGDSRRGGVCSSLDGRGW
jgi:hypothetical protein